MGIQDLSDLLHYTTSGRFSIQNVDILVPDHWDVGIDGASTFQSYEEADFKISHTFSLPFVNNPNPCGLPGYDMQLPYNFFDFGDSGNYGRLGTALLVQFARLRFGVWEEHGFPGDSKFPYYWKRLLGREWEINACTNVPIGGVYKTIPSGAPCGPDPDDVDNLYPPRSDCRFFPNEFQTANSSLMSYHYLPTFEAFCKNETHDVSQPTPQNYYCRYTSVMDVMKNTSDWKMVTGNNTAGRIGFRVVTRSEKPMLYILLDAGFTQVPAQILPQISSRLSTFIQFREMRSVVAGLGKFPGDDPNQAFTEVIPWTSIRNASHEFVSAFHSTFGNQAGFKDYAGALRELVVSFNRRKHAAGAVILIVKLSPEPNTGRLTMESQVIIPLLLSNVAVFALEVHGSPIQAGNALEHVVEKSEGLHLSISQPSDLGQPFDDFLTALTTTLAQGRVIRSKKYVVGMDEMVRHQGKVGFASSSRITQFELFATPLTGRFSSARLWNGTDGNYGDVVLQGMKWDSAESGGTNGRRNFYFSSPEGEEPLSSVRWTSLSIGCDDGPCIARVTVLLQVEDLDLIPEDVKLTVTTSAMNGIVDFKHANAGLYTGTAFAIYAKLEQDGIPFQATPGLVVTAVISCPTAPDVHTWSVELRDDGSTSPDMATNDGIFSGEFVPTIYGNPADFDGMYEIFVTAKFDPPVEETTTPWRIMEDASQRFSSIGRLFPIDQRQIGCGSGYLGCWSKIPEEAFIISCDLEKSVEFVNFGLFRAYPTRIVDLVVTPLGNNFVNLQWTEPGIKDPNPNNDAQVGAYEIRHQDEISKLLYQFDSAENLPGNKIPNTKPPGSRQNVTYDFGREASRYYAIRTLGQSQSNGVETWSDLSVIVGVNIKTTLDASTTTTTTTTTIRPTTRTTLPPRTTSPGSTTMEEDVSTLITTPRTTKARGTTTRATTTTTTTVKPSTFAPRGTDAPINHWFETTEGIITISVFGGAVFTLSILGGGFYMWLIKFRYRSI
ncbi:Calcium-activated chloride channel regulator 4A [Folsomia candida]|uniref:Calcium-activated chloride channel regulator 4A n=2 Tax=Folsomia candida TaxID=158441 RepID=A0A226DKV0_FOLCA|nr:Calcium-activated chloride channel regulator 4A [Folsomia candida]